jgi:drug/metabolite transporter (DMT)-like permease
LVLLLPFVFFNRGRSFRLFLALGPHGLVLTGCLVICQACTVGALYLTSVANVTVIYATAPFLAAGLAWMMFGEVVLGRTVLAGIASLIGVLVIVAGSVGGGHVAGNLLALGMTLSFAFVIVIPRARSNLPMLPVTILSAFATWIIFSPLGSVATMDRRNWVVLVAFGFTNFAVALFLFLSGSRRIPAAAAALIGTLEIVFAPLWVWLLFGEWPAPLTLIGGALILAAVVWHTAIDFVAVPKSRRGQR